MISVCFPCVCVLFCVWYACSVGVLCVFLDYVQHAHGIIMVYIYHMWGVCVCVFNRYVCI